MAEDDNNQNAGNQRSALLSMGIGGGIGGGIARLGAEGLSPLAHLAQKNPGTWLRHLEHVPVAARALTIPATLAGATLGLLERHRISPRMAADPRVREHYIYNPYQDQPMHHYEQKVGSMHTEDKARTIMGREYPAQFTEAVEQAAVNTTQAVIRAALAKAPDLQLQAATQLKELFPRSQGAEIRPKRIAMSAREASSVVARAFASEHKR